MLPEFNEKGYLPPGLYQSDFEEIQQRFGNTIRRQELLKNLYNFVDIIRRACASRLILDGSFVTNKKSPSDIDAILVMPDDFDTTSNEARVILESHTRFNIHLFPVQESENEFLRQWIEFFGYDRNGEPKGLVEVLL